jgi:GST-like protein
LFPSNIPVQNPDIIQLYSIPTPNGQKISIALEEFGLAYEPHRMSFGPALSDPEYRKLSPNGKIPTLVDPNGPGGEPLVLMETGAILHYLARKTGKLMPTDPAGENQVLQWLLFQVGHVGPMFGQFGHFFKFAKDKTTDSYGVDRYTNEAKRLLGVLDKRMQGRHWIVGDFSIADIAIVPWINALDFYEGKEALEYSSFENVVAWVERFNARPAVQRGASIPAEGQGV